MNTKDKVEINIMIERQENGTVSISRDIKGFGFQFFELVGILQMISNDFIQESCKVAKYLPNNVKTRIFFNSENDNENK